MAKRVLPGQMELMDFAESAQRDLRAADAERIAELEGALQAFVSWFAKPGQPQDELLELIETAKRALQARREQPC